MSIIEKQKRIRLSAIAIATLLSAPASAFGQITGIPQKTGSGFEVPRGRNVLPEAGNCAIGPFNQTSKAGRYNGICESMPEAEKCLAFIKQHVSSNGEMRESSEKAKAQYCLDVFQQELAGEVN